MLESRIGKIEALLRDFVLKRYQVEISRFVVETPPRVEFGDLAFTFPFELAKSVGRPPRMIAEEIADELEAPEEVQRFEAAGPGFLNVFFDRARFFQDLYHQLGQQESPEVSGGKVIIEHTNINPNKAAHIGHLRNAILGDSFARLVKATGQLVEIQNYIDNTGVQVADVVVGFHHLREMTLEQVQKISENFDYYCWDLYAEVSDWYREDESRLRLRQEALHSIEEGKDELAALGEYISNRIVKAHLKTMGRIGVDYDLLPRESEILQMKFWEEAFKLLREKKAVYFAEEGANQGCWVMRLPGENRQPDEHKIIVRSNGTVTYVGKDIAYQLWKFGLLGRTFRYRPFQVSDNGKIVWVTTSQDGERDTPAFGQGDRVYNVIDVRQSYLQRVVVHGLRSLGYDAEAAHSIHFSYEMVALSPACCAELGIELNEEDKRRPYVEVSGRKGLGIKADDLIDQLVANTLQEVNQRQPDLSQEERDSIARKIAVGALRYFMLKYTRNSVIAFDFQEALSFEGETGPYLQYSVVRSNNIFNKLRERHDGWREEEWRGQRDQLWRQTDFLQEALSDDEIWVLLLQLGRIAEALGQSIETLELATTAKHAFTVAQQFNYFYHRHHILSEADERKRDLYLTVTDAARQGLLNLLGLMGIQVPERM